MAVARQSHKPLEPTPHQPDDINKGGNDIVSCFKHPKKSFDKTFAYYQDEVNSIWSANHEQDLKEDNGQYQHKDDPGPRTSTPRHHWPSVAAAEAIA